MKTYTKNEFERHFFPKAYEKKTLKEMTPREFGEYLAEETIKKYRKEIRSAIK